VISNLVDYKDVVVYGVEIRGMEGRAGMAALFDPSRSVDLNKDFLEGLKRSLPIYARPIFIRILTKLDLTGKCFLFFHYGVFMCNVLLFTC